MQHEGDIIEVLQEDASGWWRGLLDGQEGVFPSNFTEPYEEEGEPEKGEACVLRCEGFFLKRSWQTFRCSKRGRGR